LEATVRETRRLVAPGSLEQAFTTQAMAPGALEQAYTTHAGAGLIAIELKSGKIVHQSPSFQALTSWIPAEARGNIRVSLEDRDGDNFHSFCERVVSDAGEPYGETFLGRDNVVGRSVTVRFFTRAPGPPGLRNPEWLLMIRAVNLTLVGVQPRQLAGELPAAGRGLLFFGQARIPEAIGVFTADLSGGTPQQWTLQVAHVRYLLDLEVASGTYDMEVGELRPLERVATYAATSALNVAQRFASWLTRTALTITQQWSMRLEEDDTVSISTICLIRLVGLSTSVSVDFIGGKVGFSHGGLEALYFVADPSQPLDGNLRAMWIRIPPAKTGGEFDVHHPSVAALTWGYGNFQSCTTASLDIWGTKVLPVEDVSELFQKLKVSPGAGLFSDGNSTICVGESDGQPISNSGESDGPSNSPDDLRWGI